MLVQAKAWFCPYHEKRWVVSLAVLCGGTGVYIYRDIGKRAGVPLIYKGSDGIRLLRGMHRHGLVAWQGATNAPCTSGATSGK